MAHDTSYVSERGMVELEKKNMLVTDKVEKLEFCEPCVFGMSEPCILCYVW